MCFTNISTQRLWSVHQKQDLSFQCCMTVGRRIGIFGSKVVRNCSTSYGWSIDSSWERQHHGPWISWFIGRVQLQPRSDRVSELPTECAVATLSLYMVWTVRFLLWSVYPSCLVCSDELLLLVFLRREDSLAFQYWTSECGLRYAFFIEMVYIYGSSPWSSFLLKRVHLDLRRFACATTLCH